MGAGEELRMASDLKSELDMAGAGSDAFAPIAERVRRLQPSLRDRAERTEELRQLPPETEQDLHDAQVFRILQPKRVGGLELDYVALVDCADLLALAVASVAWFVAFLACLFWL